MTKVWLFSKGSVKKEHVETIESLDDLSTPSNERLQKNHHHLQQNMIKKGHSNSNKNQPKHGSIPTIVYIHNPTTTITESCQNDAINNSCIVSESKKKRSNFIPSFIRNFIHRSKSSKSDTTRQLSRGTNTEKVMNNNNNNIDTKITVKVDNCQEQQSKERQPLEKVTSMKDNNHTVQSKTKPPGGSKYSTISTSSFSSSTTLLDLDESYNPICVTMINDTIMNKNNNKKQKKSIADQYMKNMYPSSSTTTTLKLPNENNKQKITNHHMESRYYGTSESKIDDKYNSYRNNNDKNVEDDDDDDDIYDEILREPFFMVSHLK